MKLRLLAIALAVVLGWGATPAAAQAPAAIKVRFALLVTPGTNHAPLYMARDLGYFAKQGIEVEFVPVDATPAALAGLVSGSVQFAFAGSNLPDAVVAGVPIVAILSTINLPTAEICAHSSIATVRDLAGKTIAVTNRGSAPDVTLRIWLEKQGYKDGEVNVRNLDAGIPAIVAAILGGTAHAFALNPPRCLLYAANGFRPLADVAVGGEFFNGGVVVTRDYLTASRDTVRRFVAAVVVARRVFQEDREVALAAVKSLDKITDQALAESVFEFFKTHLANPPLISAEGMLQATRYSMNPVTRDQGAALLSRMYDNSVVQEVLAK
jgi:ABC-type nitrate/sulfonate/bicarbonate transport system substrate-binding protein